MENTREYIMLKNLDSYKWDEQFRCLKCGNKTYIKGDEPFSRRCSNSKCKRDVSLKKYTAFEGVRFPIEKAIGILEYIIDHSYFDPDEKMIPFGERRRFGYELVSMYDLIKISKQNNWTPGRIDEELQAVLNQNRPSIGKLAKEFEVEENTVLKFLEKVSNRIPNRIMNQTIDPLYKLIECVNYKEITELDLLLRIVMVPLVGEWKFGLREIDGKWYTVDGDSKSAEPWSVFEAKYSEREKDYFSIGEEIKYGSDEWYELFKEN
ncbi:hypothetical protein CJD36_016825 [Flavipsychrobacter stenotrophus]|uniref:Uncharacterized protein n=1 Tax=Flavipsychrobacter stenotrophus TaxID=2077091 RepID=A0A2S7SRR5_9BACT|nr:hypothetical protein [Flavipsychrobacter stenotrophus]PQJ09603.1 hypothetical protein CJD36_016825 [Flavipsychrobacter stenotrophus]